MDKLEVHPVADLFPMLADDELKDLAADIAERGLLQPIVLDKDGRILDGRNRYAACKIVKVKPEFETYEGDDPDGYALMANIARRQMTKGQKALVIARFLRSSGTGRKRGVENAASVSGVRRQRISEATTVIDHAADYVELITSGAETLDKAYEVARTRKQQTEDASDEMTTLRSEAPDLADEVTEERLTLEDALELLKERRKEAERQERVAEVDEVIIGDGSHSAPFAKRVEEGHLTWADAATLAEKWLEERKEGISRNAARLCRIAESWGAVRDVLEDPERPIVIETLDALPEAHRDLILEITKKLNTNPKGRVKK